MRITNTLASVLLALALAACSGIETRPAEIDQFAAGNYKYYKWRTEPLQNTINSTDRIYIMDPIVRREVDSNLQNKGYILDEERAQFSVDYLQAPGMRMGAESEQASNISPYPSVVPNRRVDGASVDNAIALGGGKRNQQHRHPVQRCEGPQGSMAGGHYQVRGEREQGRQVPPGQQPDHSHQQGAQSPARGQLASIPEAVARVFVVAD